MNPRRAKIVVSLWHLVCGLFTAMDIREYPHLEDIEEFLTDVIASHSWDLHGHHLYIWEWSDYAKNPRSGGSVERWSLYVARSQMNEETRLISLAELYMAKCRYSVEMVEIDGQ